MNIADETPSTYGKLRTEIVIPNEVTPSLNELLRKNGRFVEVSLRKRFEWLIAAATRNQHKGPVRLELYRHCSGQSLDDDNYRGGAKPLVDALVRRGVLAEDTNEVLVERHYEQVKIKRNGPKMMVIVITDL
ncbi:hypothetical protein [Spirosoma sp. 209]|uniref:hypothetical protein n=1 Tax=Spirosoma sp. 209 TaxID=1955701 RepID=UPI00098D34A3|nr:hypothetical protein [Spirosoma sp. 209]